MVLCRLGMFLIRLPHEASQKSGVISLDYFGKAITGTLRRRALVVLAFGVYQQGSFSYEKVNSQHVFLLTNALELT